MSASAEQVLSVQPAEIVVCRDVVTHDAILVLPVISVKVSGGSECGSLDGVVVTT